ncbi:MAG: thiamine pyrophosphate-dependent dehydrogenase E1 component subunit alpha [Kiritimatiellae bacterium]|nr:thiamine pyrophosphate-dependent dehydrogenase E1 component subunit alpha [Kiritimatiellia bacterium]
MDKSTAEWIWQTMVKIRLFEEEVERLLQSGELPGFAHFYLGQEACASGVCANLAQSDYITSTHRGHGHCIAKGGRLDKMMAELYAKETGYNKGKGGSMHIASPEIGILGANGIVGGGIPLATGAALSSKLKKDGKVTVCFFGDGATNQGSCHESMNFGAAFQLPIVYVCENNQFGVGTRISEVTREPDLGKRAIGYGMPFEIADGQDVFAVHDVARKAIANARAGGGPTMLELKTWRYRAHFSGEPAVYRTKEEEAEWLKRDPLEIAKKQFLDKKLLDKTQMKEIQAAAQAELEAAVEFGRTSPEPALESALADVYA